MTGCRITTLRHVDSHRNANAPFTLTTACGWTTQVAQGVPWAGHPARDLWLGHACPARKDKPA